MKCDSSGEPNRRTPAASVVLPLGERQIPVSSTLVPAVSALAQTDQLATRVDQLSFRDLFDVAEIQRIQDAFAAATRVASIITDPDGHPLTAPSNYCRLCKDVIRQTERGLANCMRSDAVLGRPNPAGPIMQPCLSCGLWDAGASIFAGDRHIANWLIGQVRNEALDEHAMHAYAREIGADPEVFSSALAEVPIMPKTQFEQVCHALFLVANQMSQVAYQNVQLAVQVAERKRAEAERQRLEAQLRQVQKLEAVGQLAGGVAHDFNNILTAILGNVELGLSALGSPLASSDTVRQALEQIDRSAQRAAELTHQLLAFSRQQISQPQVLDLNRMLAEMEKMLRRLLTENILLSLRQAPQLKPVRIDAGSLEQVIVNLAVNARDAMPDGGRLLLETADVVLDEAHARQHADARPGPHVMLAVSDTGIGMSRETQERIFEPFFTTKGLGRGTGLGLATVYGIIKQAGGHITVYSEVGRGASFRIYLPAVEAPLAVPEIVRDGEPTPGGSETILVCEDAEPVRALATRILISAGYTVLAAENGEQALELAAAHPGPIDALVTDVMMPGMNGRAVSDALTARYPALRTLFVSGYTANVIAHHGVLDEGVEFLEKPFTRESLLRRVRDVLDRTRVRSPRL